MVDIGTWLCKGSVKHKSAALLKNHHRVCISRSIQNGWAFKMVVVSTGCAIAVNYAFNYIHVFMFTDQIRANIALEIKRMHRRRQLPYPSCSPPHPGSSPSASPGISPSASPPPQDCLAHTSNSPVSFYTEKLR